MGAAQCSACCRPIPAPTDQRPNANTNPPQEISRVTLRQRQEREQRYAHINGIKIHNQWRMIMRMSKVCVPRSTLPFFCVPLSPLQPPPPAPAPWYPPPQQVEELRKQIEVLSQNHEREVDRKDALVQVGRARRRPPLLDFTLPL